jgi:hypothetical protein
MDFSFLNEVCSRLLPALLFRRAPDQEGGQQGQQQRRPEPFRGEGDGTSEKDVPANFAWPSEPQP